MESETRTSPPPPVALFKRRGKGKSNIRKRDDDDDDKPTDAVRARGASETPSKRLKTTVAASSSSSSSAAAPSTSMAGDDSASSSHDSGSRRAGPPPAGPTYKPLANQTSFITRNPNAPDRRFGPIKAPPSSIRTTTVTDFAPDVCKDYKQTGFCGFGDNCKFLHDRGDYKQGWQLDREWETVASKGKRGGPTGTVVASMDKRGVGAEGDGQEEDDEEAEAAMLENIPFACVICKESYREPVQTRCGHYFCEPCALKRYRKDPSCAACGSGTNGVFNSAKKLKKLLERKKQREERLRKAAIEAGEEVDDDDDDDDRS